MASGWCFVSGLEHDARHSVACMGQVAEAAQTLMTDDTAHGSVLITEDVEFKVRADFECLSVAPHNMLESTIQRLGTSNRCNDFPSRSRSTSSSKDLLVA